MAILTPKLRSVSTGYIHWCPGCKRTHPLPSSWHFDGNIEAPTFSPSFLHYMPADPEDGVPQETLCHYFIAGGRIQFCGDCPHELAAQTVEMPDIPASVTLGLPGAE